MNPPPPTQPERRREPPPDLSDDVLAEIFFRIPPDEPAVLVRLSAICKSWRRLLSDRIFLRRYHALHRAPPILGFFCEEKSWAGSFSSFVSTTSFRPIIPDRGGGDRLIPCDSRHGRALFITQPPLQLLVLDPITGMERPLCVPQLWTNIQWSAAVLCAVDGCGHLDCHGRAFRVALVGTDNAAGTTHAAVYSSETYAWSDPTSIDHHPNARVQARRPSVFVGNALYFLCGNNTRILEFDMTTMTLSVIPSPLLADPERVYGALLVTAEGSGLGFAAILERSNLHLWSKEEATDQWKHLEHVRDLETLLPYTVDLYRMSNLLIGFADGGGVRVVVVRTHDGVFTVELGSTRRPKKVSRRSAITAAFPYTSFCTPARIDQKQGTMREEALTPPSTPTTLLSFACCSSAPPGGESLARFSFFLATSSSSAANISSSRCACSLAVASPGNCCFSSSVASSVATISLTSCLDRAA
uniref:Uncharacterized protein n=1 Tax=Oryza punctata TaxID=4537 RepID=A0A0E0LA00_ORYPU